MGGSSSLDTLKTYRPPGLLWLAVPAAFFACGHEFARASPPTPASLVESASRRTLAPCPSRLPPPVPVGRAGVLADVAVQSVGRSCPVSDSPAEHVSSSIWRDPAVLFCTPSVGLCWLWSELGFAEGGQKAFDVDELCLIAMEARLSAESGFYSQNSATFCESLGLWDVDAAALSAGVLRAGPAGRELSRVRCRQRSSSPRALVFSDGSRSRGRSLGARAGPASCSLDVSLVGLSVASASSGCAATDNAGIH